MMVSSSIKFLTAAATIALVFETTTVSAYWIFGHKPLVRVRVDPIVSPGAISGHAHTIVGSSAISENYDYATQVKGQCTTASVQQDQSSYWAPTLFSYSGGQFTAMQMEQVKTYYLQRLGTDPNDKIVAFPPGLRMLAGNMNRRTYNASNFADQAVSYVCLDYNTNHGSDPNWVERGDFFPHNCPNGLRAQIFFPSCGDGRLDSPDHQSHLAYPIQNYNSGDCPASHPIHYISIFYEFIYLTQNYPFDTTAGATNWILSTGDTTGLSLHADFINGWPQDLLQTAIDDPTCGLSAGGNVDSCNTLAGIQDQAAASACQPQNPLPYEAMGDNGTPILKLPGCNPIWSGPGAKPTCATPAATVALTSGQSVIPSNWASLGCISEPANGRALTGPHYSNPNNTAAVCIAFCSSYGLPIAGVEYGVECYCGTALSNGATKANIASSSCSIPCGANQYENCGGSRTLNLFMSMGPNTPSTATTTTPATTTTMAGSTSAAVVSPTTTSTTVPKSKPTASSTATKLQNGWQAAGCAIEAKNARTLTGYSFTSSGTMTNDLCATTCASHGFTISGTEYASECYCGNSFTNGAGQLDTSSPSGGCNMACSNTASGQTCGGPNRLTIYKGASSVSPPILPAGWSAYGCVTEAMNSRTLSGYSFTSSTSMTVDLCTATCNSKGFTMAGVEYASECYCGNAFGGNGGGVTATDPTNCSMQCSGAVGTICGGPNRLSVYKAGAAISKKKAVTTTTRKKRSIKISPASRKGRGRKSRRDVNLDRREVLWASIPIPNNMAF